MRGREEATLRMPGDQPLFSFTITSLERSSSDARQECPPIMAFDRPVTPYKRPIEAWVYKMRIARAAFLAGGV
jgi:hypothetical protein